MAIKGSPYLQGNVDLELGLIVDVNQLDDIYNGYTRYLYYKVNPLWDSILLDRSYVTILLSFYDGSEYCCKLKRKFVGAGKVEGSGWDIDKTLWAIDIGCAVGGKFDYKPFADYDVE